MKVLVLGGTIDGRVLAQTLSEHAISVTYSVAGLVRVPDIACDVISGGFTQYGGLSAFIKANHIQAILDATHPYAELISTKAINAARECGIACWRFYREPWQPQAKDQWRFIDTWDDAFALLAHKRSVFIAAGQMTQSWFDTLSTQSFASAQQYILRTAKKPEAVLPSTMLWVEGIGPFSYESERDLFERYRVECLLTKNSGGDAVAAKLQVARELNIPVLMLNRPVLPQADMIFTTYSQCTDYILGIAHAG